MTSLLSTEQLPREDSQLSFHESLALYGTEMSPSVIAEADQLAAQGVSVEVYDVQDSSPDDERRVRARQLIDRFEQEDPEIAHAAMYGSDRPSLANWREGALGTGLGIYPLYNAKTAKTLGEGIDLDIFHEPLFTDDNGEKLSALQVLAREKDEEFAKEKLDLHEKIINYEIDEESRIIFSGSEDSVGIRVRSQLAKEMALRAVESHDKSKPLVLASLGAGSAIPAIETMLHLEKHGYQIDTYHFVDIDPMALATALSLVRAQGIDESKIKLHIENLLNPEITSIEPGSVDVVDAWGLAEYFPGKLAIGLTKAAHQLLAADGTYVYGNMLTERLQKDYFKNVVRWRPKVRTRTLSEGLQVLTDAGFTDAYVGLPSRNGVYAGYAGRKNPETSPAKTSMRKQGKTIVALSAS